MCLGFTDTLRTRTCVRRRTCQSEGWEVPTDTGDLSRGTDKDMDRKRNFEDEKVT